MKQFSVKQFAVEAFLLAWKPAFSFEPVVHNEIPRRGLSSLGPVRAWATRRATRRVPAGFVGRHVAEPGAPDGPLGAQDGRLGVQRGSRGALAGSIWP